MAAGFYPTISEGVPAYPNYNENFVYKGPRNRFDENDDKNVSDLNINPKDKDKDKQSELEEQPERKWKSVKGRKIRETDDNPEDDGNVIRKYKIIKGKKPGKKDDISPDVNDEEEQTPEDK